MPTTVSFTVLRRAANSLLVDDEDDVDEVAARVRRIEDEVRRARDIADMIGLRSTGGSRQNRSYRSTQSSQRDDGSEEAEEDLEDNLADGIAEIIDLTDDEYPAPETSQPAPRHEERRISSYSLENGIVLRVGVTVELRMLHGAFGIQFVRVQSLVQLHGSDNVQIRGWGYARTRQLAGILPCKLNEVAMVAEINNSDPRPWAEQALVEVPVTAVKQLRELRVTNALFPEHRYDPSVYAVNGKEWVEEQGPLVCRYQYRIHFNRGGDKPCEWALARICESDADALYRLPDDLVLNRWRGGKVPGGSYNPAGSVLPVVDLDTTGSNINRPLTLSPGQRYTAGDVFAGAGGASRGIERAGVQLLFAVDHWPNAAESLRSNFPKSDIYEMEVNDFILSKNIRYHVDILHLSPPCQFWSPAHTVAGRNDEHNIAVLYSCTHLIAKFRPRLFTLEQTFGILSPRFTEYFNLLVDGFTRHGYSVRWKAVPLANYGVPQLRRRLIMIGSAPGEKLPPLPPPTHSKNGAGGLKPWATPRSVLAPLRNVREHELHRPDRRWNPPKPRWDPDQLAKTITTNGGQNYHWSGERDFTLLEYAVLQGFPTWHKFRGNYIKKQIGNAFAPSVVRVLYEHLVAWLLRQDGFDPRSARPQSRAALVLPLDLSRSNPTFPAAPDDDDDYNDEIICLGSHPNPTPSPSAAMTQPRLDAIGASEDIEMPDRDDRSDSETLRGDDDNDDDDGGQILAAGQGDRMDIYTAGVAIEVIDLTTGSGSGTADDPWKLSD